jgi:hypothetical protein
MDKEKIQGYGHYKNLDGTDCACLDQVCSNCNTALAFFKDMEELGLPAEEYIADAARTLQVAQALRQKAFPTVPLTKG